MKKKNVDLISLSVAGLLLLWAMAESLSMATNITGGMKIIPYFVGFTVISLAWLGLSQIKDATSESYISHRNRKLVSGVALYAMAFLASISFGTHNIYYFANKNDIRQADLKAIYLDLNGFKDAAERLVRKKKSDLQTSVQNKLKQCIDELDRPERPGNGGDFQTCRNNLSDLLDGAGFENLTAEEMKPGRIQEGAKEKFRNNVRDLLKQKTDGFDAVVKPVNDLACSETYLKALGSVKNAIDKHSVSMGVEVDTILENAFLVRVQLREAVERAAGELGANVKSTAYGCGGSSCNESVPSSVEFRKPGYFWGLVFSEPDAGGQDPLDRGWFLWAIIFSMFLEVAFFAFWFRAHNDRD